MLCGTQGIGKTETAKYYSHWRTDLNIVWIDCRTEDSLRMCLSKYLERESVSGSVQNPKDEAEKLFRRLRNALIIFDDANDIEIQQWIEGLPKGTCRYLVTTYNSSGVFMQEMKIQVEKLDLAQGSSLFLKLLPENKQNQPLEVIEQLILFCGGLPLAIRQAAAYISRTGIMVKDFLENLQKDLLAGEVLDQDADGIPYLGKMHQGVYLTFKQTYDLIFQKEKDNRFYAICLKILQYLAFLDPLCISEAFFRSLDSDFTDETYFNNAILVAIQFGLLEREGSLKIQGVIQQVIRQLMTNEERRDRLGAIVGKLSRQSLEIVAAQRDFDVMLPVFLHTSYIQSLRGYELISNEGQIADLYCLRAEFLFVIGDYSECEIWYQKVGKLGDGMPKLRAWIGLALLCENRDDYKNAQMYIQMIEENGGLLSALKETYPKDWMSYLEVKGYLSLDEDRPQQALDFYIQSIDYLQWVSMGGHQKKYKKMLALNGMGMSYERLGQYEMAEQYLKKALDAGNEAFCGYDRVPAAMVMVIGNYGSFLSRTEHFDEAESCLKEEERLYENWIQEWKAGFDKKNHMHLWRYFFADRNVNDFIDYAKNQYSLGNLYYRRNRAGDMDLVLAYMQRGKRLLQDAHADTHILMLNIDTFLCGSLYQQGFYDQTIIMGTSILEKEQEFVDNDSAKNTKSLICLYLSYAYQECRKYREAVSILKRALVYTRACTRKNEKREAELQKRRRNAWILLILQKCRIIK